MRAVAPPRQRERGPLPAALGEGEGQGLHQAGSAWGGRCCVCVLLAPPPLPFLHTPFPPLPPPAQVFFIRSPAAAAEYLTHWQHSVPASCSVLAADFRCAEDNDLRYKMLISLGNNKGLSKFSAYSEEGLVTAVLDSLGAKVGAAFSLRARR